MSDKIAFRPVIGTNQQILSQTPQAGHVWFATDSKKIYYSDDTSFLSMGGNTSIYYGKKQLTDDEKYGEVTIFYFTFSDIDSEDLPSKDDLILNIPDGGFYRVLEINDVNIATQRLAMSGSGGNNEDINQGSLIINYVTPQYSSTITNVEYYIEFDIEARDSAGDLVGGEGNATWRINGQSYSQKVKNGRNRFRVDEYLDPSLDSNAIILIVTMHTGGAQNTVQSKTWNVKAVDLRLEWPWSYSDEEYFSGDNFILKFYPYGGINCEAHISFDNGLEEGVTYFIENIAANKTGKEYPTSAMPSLSYGAHSCDIWLTATVNGVEYKTDAIRHEITFISNGVNTILTVPYYETTATQYDTISIPFLVYDPDTEKCNVSFYVNDKRVSGDSFDRGLHYWPYSLTDFGSVKLSLRSDNGEAEKNIELIVNKLDIPHEEASGAAFSLKATAFSGNDELLEWNDNGVTLTFSANFDWKKGGLQFETMDDGSIEKYICVRQGTRMYINYKLFEKFTTGSTGGKNFKFCFKATNCYDYGAKVLSCYDASSGVGIEFDAQKAVFKTPTYPNFATQYCENSYIEVETEIWPNVDDKEIGTEGKIYGDRFLMFWVDGVPAGVKAYSPNEPLEQIAAQAKVIEIGSDECDVYVYVAKAYERKLSEDQHLDNFVMDAPSANKMIDRYRRNAILDARGEISYEKLVAANPNCHAYLYEIPYMTTSKDVKVDDCTYYELFGEHNTLANPLFRAEKARTYVQGTSSAAYGVAAFNLRTDFLNKGKIYDGEGNELPGWTVSDTAIPINIACTKVNVASCENANNVVNAEWYNKFQPYHDAHRRKIREDGKIYRDTMEFNSGVVFIKDNNPITNYLDEQTNNPTSAAYLEANVFLDTPGYCDVVNQQTGLLASSYYKMYAIGNMGNDKKNSEIFHDIANPWALCVEVTNSQNAEHWMTTAVDMSQFDADEPFHEFRYPDGNKKATTEQKQAWLDFVNWMVASNPNGGNEAHILKATIATVDASTYKKNVYFIQDSAGNYIKATGNFDSSETYYTIRGAAAQEGDTTINVLFDNYTYKGFDPPGYEGQPNPTGVSLKGTMETKYSTTKVISQPKLDANGDPILKDDGSYELENVYSIVPYTHDTFDYRMAKMLSECDDHLVMDSVMFHYLYISRHTMVDNVAKNTFWSTEDGIHWDLTRNYDNDTSDGNDNTGNLSYTYGLEFGDVGSNGKDVFNASPSVWINFIHNLPAAQQTLYKALETKGAWKASTYLAEFKKHQDPIPERCWIYDYMRKYIRPRRLGLDETTYLNRLEGGRKTHQRKQYETYQEFYFNSKYVAGTNFTDGAAIDLRLNKDSSNEWSTENILPITFYIDCYATIHLGGQLVTSTRLKRGDSFNAPVGRMIGAPNDATCYIYGANMIQTLSGLDKLYPGYAKLTGANKLREIEFGSNAPGYKNERLKSLDIGSNGMLQKVQMWNCGSPTEFGSLILDSAYQLKELYLSGSEVKELMLANGAATEILELNSLTTITMSNLSNLTTVTLDSGIATSLKNMFIDNCPRMDQHSYNWAKSNELARYHLTDFHWVITNNTPNNDFIFDDNSKVTSIIALDNLNDENTGPQPGSTTATALTGRLTINVPCAIDEFTIYKKYIRTYPNLIIDYKDVGENYNPAATLTFLKDKDSVEQHYRVLGPKTATWIDNNGVTQQGSLAVLVSSNGPTGIAMTQPFKESSESQTFTFSGYWIDKANPSVKYYNPMDFTDNNNHPDGAISFEDCIPSGNMTFYPEYTATPKVYAVKFYDWNRHIIPQKKVIIEQVEENGTIVDKETVVYVDEWLVPYGSVYDGPMKNYYYRNSDALLENERWAFQGWSQNKYEDGKIVENADYINLSNLVVYNTVLLYGHFLIEDCTEIPSKLEYFSKSGNAIRLNDEYKEIVQGKITIPFSMTGTTITQIASQGFAHNNKITHVFFQRNNQSQSAIQAIKSEAFDECTNLIYCDFPDSLTEIGYAAFRDAPLQSKNGEYSFGNNIQFIGQHAFNSALSIPSNGEITFKLPSSITTLGSMAFSNLNGDSSSSNAKINIIIGSQNNYANLQLSHETSGTISSINTIASFRLNNPKLFQSINFYTNTYQIWENTISDSSQYKIYERLCNASTQIEWLLYGPGFSDDGIDESEEQ